MPRPTTVVIDSRPKNDYGIGYRGDNYSMDTMGRRDEEEDGGTPSVEVKRMGPVYGPSRDRKRMAFNRPRPER